VSRKSLDYFCDRQNRLSRVYSESRRNFRKGYTDFRVFQMEDNTLAVISEAFFKLNYSFTQFDLIIPDTSFYIFRKRVAVH